MTRWRYVEPRNPAEGDWEAVERTFTEAEILDNYFSWWAEQMHHVGQLLMATERNCIEDWVVVNWAWRIEE